MDEFDPYQVWLGIPPAERPANFYRLFQLRLLEGDNALIAQSIERTIADVRRHLEGDFAEPCRCLLQELEAARGVLLDPLKKQAYDAGLRAGRVPQEVSIKPPPPPMAVPTSASASAPRAAPPARAAEVPITQRPNSPLAGGSEQRVGPAPPPVPGATSPAASASGPLINPPPPVPGSQQPAEATGHATVTPPAAPAAAVPSPVVPAPGVSAPAPSPERPAAFDPAASPHAFMPTPPLPPPPVERPAPGEAPAARPDHPAAASPWMPSARTGRVGKSIASVVAGETVKGEPKTAKAKSLRRNMRHQSSLQAITIFFAAAIFLAVSLIVLIIALAW